MSSVRTELVEAHSAAIMSAGVDRDAFAQAVAAMEADAAVRKAEAQAVMHRVTHFKGPAKTRAQAFTEIKSAFERRAQATENGEVLGAMFG